MCKNNKDEHDRIILIAFMDFTQTYGYGYYRYSKITA